MKRTTLLIAFMLLSLVAPAGLTPVLAAADAKSDICSGVGATSSKGTCSTGGLTLNALISDIVGILSIVIGIVAVIMVIYAGFKYVTSGGDANSISSAKSTLVYALVGLAVASLAQFLVHFVFTVTKVGP